jgi:galactose mutarotase-like enzyme
MTQTIRLEADGSTAEIALAGAELLSWRVDGQELLWSGDPEHWSYRAPILFPVVGASLGGALRVDGRLYPMPQHGFARLSAFTLVERDDASARLRLTATDETLARYPFRFFRLDVVARLAPRSLSLAFEVANLDTREMPYALGFHPAFPWPLTGASRDGHRVVFEAEEDCTVPEVAAGGLLARSRRAVPLDGRVLPLDPALFSEALVFLDARSRAFSFEAPDGFAIEMAVERFPHLAVWSRPTAPFLSLEAWTGHADWEDADGDLASRASMIRLAPGASGRHAVTLMWREPG